MNVLDYFDKINKHCQDVFTETIKDIEKFSNAITIADLT